MAKICQDHQNPFPEGPEVPEGRVFQKWFVQNLFRSLLSGILRDSPGPPGPLWWKVIIPGDPGGTKWRAVENAIRHACWRGSHSTWRNPENAGQNAGHIRALNTDLELPSASEKYWTDMSKTADQIPLSHYTSLLSILLVGFERPSLVESLLGFRHSPVVPTAHGLNTHQLIEAPYLRTISQQHQHPTTKNHWSFAWPSRHVEAQDSIAQASEMLLKCFLSPQIRLRHT